ncbi:hypothetical protein GH714_002209 [Hevea brasiliensis]|uniref:HAT C-terminal dimerisation domain-containing protein n=1 Tax=Hevea brasiliensis TaxID=3981 RepID=A0A6A6KWU1_HEVBR|nr:hypothetical protein GH714_002209 [Hevea brasiliensis]
MMMPSSILQAFLFGVFLSSAQAGDLRIDAATVELFHALAGLSSFHGNHHIASIINDMNSIEVEGGKNMEVPTKEMEDVVVELTSDVGAKKTTANRKENSSRQCGHSLKCFLLVMIRREDVLDQYRSALRPDLVEALVCTRDWLYGEQENAKLALEELTQDVMELKTEDKETTPSACSNSIDIV